MSKEMNSMKDRKLSIVVISLAFISLMNISGFSWERFAWLSDKEFLRIAADYAAENKLGERNYSSGESLLHSNPN